MITIQQIVIQLQGQHGLLQILREADTGGSQKVDVVALLDLVDSARDGTVSALMALRQRLAQSGGVTETATLSQPSTSTSVSRKSSLAPTVPERDCRRDAQEQDVLRPDFERHDSVVQQRAGMNEIAAQRSGSMLGLLKRNSTRNSPAFEMLQPQLSRTSMTRSDSYHSSIEGPVSPMKRPYNVSPFAFQEIDERQFLITAPASPDQPRHVDHAYSTVSQTSRAASVMSTTSPSAPTIARTLSLQPRHISKALVTPTAKNDYLGFCKGAWKAQNADPKAMIERRDFAQTAQSQMTFPSCSKCAFKGHEDIKHIWKKVHVDEARGLQYRWGFLAKSHVKQKSVKGRSYAYQCLFCVFQGSEAVIYTFNTYLDHVGRDHRGEVLDEVLLFRTKCVNDRVCGLGDEFDINLFPVDDRKESTVGPPVYGQLASSVRAFELAG